MVLRFAGFRFAAVLRFGAAFLRLAGLRFAVDLRFAGFRLAVLRFAGLRFFAVLLRFAGLRFAVLLRFIAVLRFAGLRFAADFRFAGLRFAVILRLAGFRFAVLRFAGAFRFFAGIHFFSFPAPVAHVSRLHLCRPQSFLAECRPLMHDSTCGYHAPTDHVNYITKKKITKIQLNKLQTIVNYQKCKTNTC